MKKITTEKILNEILSELKNANFFVLIATSLNITQNIKIKKI